MASTTYSRVNHRINFILVDSTIVPAIKRIGTLELHEGIISDHVMLYMNCDKDQLVSGIINRPVLNPSEDFVIKHAEGCEKSIDKFCKYAKEKKFADRGEALSKTFDQEGPTDNSVNQYQVLVTKITECILSTAKKVAKKKMDTNVHQHSHKRAPTFISGRQHYLRNLDVAV